MMMNPMAVLVGIFDKVEAAQRAIGELKAVGFTELQIGVVSHGKRLLPHALIIDSPFRFDTETPWGLPVLAGTAPGIGPAIAGGMLGILFWSTKTIGAAGAMVGLGIPIEDAEHYEIQFRAGRTLVAIRAGTRADIADSVLNRFSRIH